MHGTVHPEQKRRLLGRAKFQAWRAGELRLEGLVGYRVGAQWGLARFERSLKAVRAGRDSDPTRHVGSGLLAGAGAPR
jgi:hypothetical protein